MITFEPSAEKLLGASLAGFFESWPTQPTADRRLAILRAADHVVVAYDGEHLVGFVTAISDGVLSAYIPLLEVLPSHRGRGIGSELIRRILEEIGDLYMVDVICDVELRHFYERLGFTAGTAMMMRNRSALA